MEATKRWSPSEAQILRTTSRWVKNRNRRIGEVITQYLSEGRVISPEFVEYATDGTRTLDATGTRVRLTRYGIDTLDGEAAVAVVTERFTPVNVEHYLVEVEGGWRGACMTTTIWTADEVTANTPIRTAWTVAPERCVECSSLYVKGVR